MSDTATEVPANPNPVVQPELRGLDLLDAALAYITAHPEKHDQSTWGEMPTQEYGELTPPGDNQHAAIVALEGPTCGTTACLAGWVAVIGGAKITYGRWDGMMRANGGSPRSVAAEMLGIANQTALYRSNMDTNGIFHQGNTVEDLYRFRDMIAAGEY